GALNVRVRERDGRTALEHPNLGRLLQSYEEGVLAGEVRRLTWFGLLCSYFAFDPIGAIDAQTRGWEALRAFLQKSWPHVDAQTNGSLCPDWMKVLREDAGLLTENAARRYARQFLVGEESLD